MEKLPEMEMCGSFRCGSDQEKLNLLLMAEMALDTAFFALLMALEMLHLMEEKIFDTVDFAALKPLLIPLFTESTAPLTVDLIPSHTVDRRPHGQLH